MLRGRVVVFALLFLALAPMQAHASFHLWQIKEIYSNADGSIQFIELFSSQDGQEFVINHDITVSDGTTTRTFTFPANTSAGTAGKHLLLATPGFARVSGSRPPDFTLPCGPFFDPSWTTITINFVGADIVTITGSALPTDGANSLTDSNLYATASFASGTNSPTGFATTSGQLAPSTCQAAGTCEPCDDGMYCNGPETCTASTCTAVAPCAKQCIEGTGTYTCVDCIDASHCNDNNPCTANICNGSNMCENPAQAGSCDDGLFCNGTDTCSGTTCVHAGTPCVAQNCNEGPDTCGDCQGASDCEDGQSCTTDTCNGGNCARTNAADGSECDTDATYCNGVGACAAGACGNVTAPCDTATETCNEANDACTPIATVDAAVVVGDDAGTTNNNGDGGGCCQTNRSLPPLHVSLLVLLVGWLCCGRTRRARSA